MKCRRARKLIFAFLDGESPDLDRSVLEQHLGECKSCEILASRLASSLRLLHRMPPEDPSANFNWKVRLAIARERNRIHEKYASSQGWTRSWSVRFAVSAASIFILSLAGGLFVARSTFFIQPAPRGEYVAKSGSQPSETRSMSDAAADRFRPGLAANKSGVGPREVSVDEGDLVAGPVAGPFEEVKEAGEAAQSGDPNDFIRMNLYTLRYKHQIRLLQEQVDILQNDLRKCQGEKK